MGSRLKTGDGDWIMSAAYHDRNGYLRISWFCNDPKTSRRDRCICGAKTRIGTPCQAPPVWNKENDKAKNGRCKLHGGLSIGPKTEAGKNVIRISNKKRSKHFAS